MTTSPTNKSQLTSQDKSIALQDETVTSLMQQFNASVRTYSRLAQQLHGKLSQYGWSKKESTELLNANVQQVYAIPRPTCIYRGISYQQGKK